MRIQALKTMVDGREYTRKGQIVDIEAFKARELIALGYAVLVPDPDKSPAAPIAFLAANDNEVKPDPFPERRPGGLDGSAKPASLSREGQVRSKRGQTKRAAKQKS